MYPSTEMNRLILNWTLWLQWQVYHCLLYAEIESYRKMQDKLESIRYPPLSDFLLENKDAVNSLKNVRHKVLHPQKELDLGEVEIMFIKHTARSSGHSYTFVRDLQNHLDGFIGRLEEKVVARIRAAYDAPKLSNDRTDADILRAQRKLSRFKHEVPLWAFLPVPSTELPVNRILTFEQLNFWNSALQFGTGEDLTQTVPECARRAAHGMSLNVLQVYLLTAELISNETVDDEAISLRPRPGSLENYGVQNYLMHAFWQQKVGMQSTLVRIALALLMEPIRIYKDAVQNEPSCRSTAVEDVMPCEDVLSCIRKYRNKVFHVTDHDRTDPRLRDRSVDRLVNSADWKRLCENLIKWNPPQ